MPFIATPAEIAAKLDGKKAGRNWLCRCPAHDDTNPSLSVTEKKDGKILVNCRSAKCSQEAILGAMESLGLYEHAKEHREPKRRVAGSAAAAKPKPQLKPIDGGRVDEPPEDEASEREASTRGAEAVYEYLDVSRQVLFRVVRFPNKQFRQMRLVQNKWLWGLGRVTPVLYRLPEISEPTAVGIYIPEGEKDVDNLVKLGVIATCCPMGAGKWRHEYGAVLAGKHVVILPDNDEPGRKHAYQVAASCHAHGTRSIRILELPGLPEKGDVSDWLAAGHTRDELSALVHDTPAWRPDQSGGNPAWEDGLLRDEDDKPLANEANLVTALEQAPELVGRVRYELFFNRAECRNLPWDITSGDWRPWTDTDTTAFAVWAQRNRINIQANRAYRPVELVGRNQPHHAPRSYLKALKWDDVPRIDNWLTFYLGSEPAADASAQEAEAMMTYLGAVGRKFLISAVARIMLPGCKVDTMPVTEGVQGKLKSTAIKVLFGDSEWFSDHISQLGSKDSKEELAGKWCIEFSELSAMQRAEVDKIKSFMSTQVDHYRPSYGHLPRSFPRQCVFFGSTNEDAYLRDTTGGRRFWPFKAGHIDIEALRRDRDQLWAEATHRFHAGEPWHLTAEEDLIASAEQKDRIEPDVWGDVIDTWLADPAKGLGLTELTVRQVLDRAINLPIEKWDQRAQNRVAQQLKLRGWVRRRKTADDGKRKWVYELG